MSGLEERLTEAGLGRVAAKLAPLARETVRLTAVKYEEKPTSRLGGRPNLAPELEWPECDGAPLAFIAQLDLAAMPKIAGLDLPKSGALYFFYRATRHARNFKARIGRNPATGEVIQVPARKVRGFGPTKPAKAEDRRNFRVLYSAANLAELPLHGFPDELDDEYRYRGARLEPGEVEFSMPFPDDPVLSLHLLKPEEHRQYLTFIRQFMDPGHNRAKGYVVPEMRLASTRSAATQITSSTIPVFGRNSLLPDYTRAFRAADGIRRPVSPSPRRKTSRG